MDSNGILEVTAEETGTCYGQVWAQGHTGTRKDMKTHRKGEIQITNEKGHGT